MKSFFGTTTAGANVTKLISEHQLASSLNESSAAALNSPQLLNEHVQTMEKLVKDVYNAEGESSFATWLMNEDAAAAGQVLVNSITEQASLSKALNEDATNLGGVSVVAATVQTIVKQPMAANVHRLFNTKAAPSPVVEIAEVRPTVKLKGVGDFQEIYAALEKGTNSFNGLEIVPTVLQSPIALTAGAAKKVNLLQGMDSEYELNSDLRVTGVTVGVDMAGGTTYSTDDVSVTMQPGSRPYFGAKYKQLSVVFDVKKAGNKVGEVVVDANLDGSILKSVAATTEKTGTPTLQVTHVSMMGTVSHAQHLHPSTLSIESSRDEFTIPTRPHYEISITKEDQEDLMKANTGIVGDIPSLMANEAVRLANHAEDLRLLDALGLDVAVEATWVTDITPGPNGELFVTLDFEPRAGYNKTVFEYVRESCVPSLDHVVTHLKNKFHLDDSHARVLASPGFIKHATPDANVIKGTVENGPAALHEEISAVSSTNTLIFVSSSRMSTWQVKLVLIPNKKEMAERRTFDYFRYSSFLTNDLRKASNPSQPATVYMLRNAEYIGTHIGANIHVTNYIGTAGSKVVKF